MEMKKMRVLLDVDGIIADFAGAAAVLMSTVTGRTITVQDIIHWEVTEILDEHHLRDACKEAMLQPGFCSSIEAYEDSLAAVEKLSEVAEVFYVTAPMHKNPTWMPERVAWLERVLNADPRHIIFAYKKHIVDGDVFVDDHPGNVESWLEHHPSKTALLWTRPYNASHSPHLRRVTSWMEVLEEVSRLSS